MGRSEGAEVATDALRRHALKLGHGSVLRRELGRADHPLQGDGGEDLASRLRALAARIERGEMSVHSWGAPGASVSPGGPSGNNPLLVEGEAPAELQRFRKAYEAAHEAAVSRLNQLADLYDEVSIALSLTADNYDAMEGE